MYLLRVLINIRSVQKFVPDLYK